MHKILHLKSNLNHSYIYLQILEEIEKSSVYPYTEVKKCEKCELSSLRGCCAYLVKKSLGFRLTD